MAGWTGDGGRGDQQEAIEQQYEYNNKMWSYNWAETQSNYAYQQENIAIQKINEQALRNYQNQTNFNGWLNRENIRMYEYGKDVEAYNASVESYEKQLDYNDIAYDIALNDANRVYQDQLIGFGFQNQDILMKYHEGGEQASLDTKGLTNKLSQASALSGLQMRETKLNKASFEAEKAMEDAGLRHSLAAGKAEAAFKSQEQRISYLGQEGKQRNLGQAGRSAAKSVQALLAGYGSAQAAMADSISRAESKYMLDKRKISESLVQNAKMTNIRIDQIGNNLMNTKMDAQHQQDQIGLKFSQLKDRTDFNRLQLQQSMISAGEQHEANKTKLSMDKYQQDLNAAANLMARPTAPPQEISPLNIPQTTYQDPRPPSEPPKPEKAVNTVQRPSIFNTMMQIASIGASLYAGGAFSSDVALKKNIIRTGRSPKGIPIYEWNYKHRPDQRYQGVMAQDLVESYPSAVKTGPNGYLEVDYSQIDVEFKEV